MSKVYAGVFEGDGWPRSAMDHGVCVIEDGYSRPLRWRLDLVNHSPTGLSWGYAGSGPAQCALAILADALGDDRRAVDLYQAFKRERIAKLDQAQPWTMSQAQVVLWAAVKAGSGADGV